MITALDRRRCSFCGCPGAVHFCDSCFTWFEQNASRNPKFKLAKARRKLRERMLRGMSPLSAGERLLQILFLACADELGKKLMQKLENERDETLH